MKKSVEYPEVTVVILAGGKGSRMELATPKQYLDIFGKKVVEYSIEKLLPLVKQIITIVPDLQSASFLTEKYPGVILSVAHESRIDSLLSELGKIKTKYVLVHDASRPFVTKTVVDEIVTALQNYPCAYPVIPLSSSIVIENEGLLTDTPDRSYYREIQTPQGFHTEVLLEAIEKFGDQHIHIPELIRLMGKEVKHVPGSPWLFKITYQPDIHAARYYVKHEGLNKQ